MKWREWNKQIKGGNEMNGMKGTKWKEWKNEMKGTKWMKWREKRMIT